MVPFLGLVHGADVQVSLRTPPGAAGEGASWLQQTMSGVSQCGCAHFGSTCCPRGQAFARLPGVR